MLLILLMKQTFSKSWQHLKEVPLTPIAQSIVSAAKPLKNLKVEAVENIPRVGIKGQVNQNFYQIVNYKYLRGKSTFL